jgi:hypothetical protein
VRSRLVSREALSGEEKATMLALLSSHFRGVTPERFAADLEDKNWVLLLEDDRGLRGFSTLSLYETTSPEGEPLTVVYSGDTIVEKGAWSTAALPKSWIAAVRALRERHPRGRLIWLLLTSGFRTYRFLRWSRSFGITWRGSDSERSTAPGSFASPSPRCSGKGWTRCPRAGSAIPTWRSSWKPIQGGCAGMSWCASRS